MPNCDLQGRTDQLLNRLTDQLLIFAKKPIIGILGGIGSGKSFIANCFGQLGGMVINADALVHLAYARDDVKQTLRQWWGDGVFNADGTVNRRAIGAKVFSNDAERHRLENLVHPIVYDERDRQMAARANDPATTCFIWDTPLLVETGGHVRCDALVFVDVPEAVRQQRVMARGWDAAELKKREKLQLGLDKKKRLADYVISNATDAASAREQVRRVYSLIIHRDSTRPARNTDDKVV